MSVCPYRHSWVAKITQSLPAICNLYSHMNGEVSGAGPVSCEDDKVLWCYYCRQRWTTFICSSPSGLWSSIDPTVMLPIQLMVSILNIIIVSSISFLVKMLTFEFIIIVKCLLCFVSNSKTRKLAEVLTCWDDEGNFSSVCRAWVF